MEGKTMGNNRHINFDQMWAEEAEQEPILITVLGEQIELPPTLPASIPLKLIELQEKHGDKIPVFQYMSLAALLFGRETLDRLAAKRDAQGRIMLTSDRLGSLIRETFRLYNPAFEQEDGQPKNA
jgi:hypothetical protein